MEFRLKQPIDLYHMKTEFLNFEMEYVLEMHGTNAKNDLIEGEKCIFTFQTPTCYQVYNNTLTKCRKREAITIPMDKMVKIEFQLKIKCLCIFSTFSTCQHQFHL